MDYLVSAMATFRPILLLLKELIKSITAFCRSEQVAYLCCCEIRPDSAAIEDLQSWTLSQRPCLQNAHRSRRFWLIMETSDVSTLSTLN